MIKYFLFIFMLFLFVCADVYASETFVTDKGIYKSAAIEVEPVNSEESVFYVFLESDVTSRRDVVMSASQAGDCLNIHVLNDSFVLTDLVSGFNISTGGYINKDKTQNKYRFVLNLRIDSGYGCSFFVFNLRGYNKPSVVLDTLSKCFTKADAYLVCFKKKSYWQERSFNNLSVYIPSLNRYTTDAVTIKKYLLTGTLESEYVSYQLSTASATASQFDSVLYDYGLETPTFDVKFVGRVYSFTPLFVVDNILYRWFTVPEARSDINTSRFVKRFLTKTGGCVRECF